MSTTAPNPVLTLRPLRATPSVNAAGTATHSTTQTESARSLAVMLLAAVVAAMVVLADRLINTWADGHLFLAWVALWVVVFAGMALFASTARTIAQRTVRSLDGWSQTIARARADARLWSIAQSDPRLMQELQQALMRERAEADESVAGATPSGSFSDALAPLGMSNEVAAPTAARGSAWSGFIERLSEQRSRNMHLYYI
jgi:Ca2+/Na+ antiporter